MAIDWSGAQGARQKGIAVALCSDAGEAPRLLQPEGHARWAREDVLALLIEDLPENTLVGLDLGISLPFADAGAFFPGWKGELWLEPGGSWTRNHAREYPWAQEEIMRENLGPKAREPWAQNEIMLEKLRPKG